MAEQGPPSNDDILIDAPDGTRLAFPSSMSMDEIKGVMRRKYGAQRSATPAPQFGAGTPSAPASFQQPLRPMSTPMNGTAGGVSSGGPGGSPGAPSSPASPSPAPAPKGGSGATPPAGSPLPDGFDAAGDAVTSLKDFERRAMDPRQPSIRNDDGSYSTHKMASAQIGGMHIAYPTIVMKDGKLTELGDREAIDHALTTGEFRRFDSDASAQKYAEGGYKAGTALTEQAQAKRAKEEDTTGSILRHYGRKSDERAALRDEMAEFDKHYRDRTGRLIDQPSVHKELFRIGSSIENADKGVAQVSDVFNETADRIVKDAMAGEGIKRFTLDDGDEGHVDHVELNRWVEEMRQKYGYTSTEVDDQLRTRVERAVQERPIEKLFNKEMEPVLEAIGKERADAFKEAFGNSPEAISADSVYQSAEDSLTRERDRYGALAKAEADQENSAVQQEGARLLTEYDTAIAGIQQAYDTGRIDQAAANQQAQAINEAHRSQVSQLVADNTRRINAINAKYNRAYNLSKQAINEQADRSIAALQDKFAKTYAEDPELAERLKAEANAAWGRVSEKVQSTKVVAEQMRRDLLGANAPLDVFARSTAGAMGSTVAGLGSAAGMDGIRAWGKWLEQAHEMPPAKTKELGDWLDVNNLSQITGQVAGSMLPGMVAGGAVTVGSGGLGAPAGLSMVLGGAVNWASEAYSASANLRDEVYASTMDRAKADKAGADLFQSYVDIAPTFAFDMLPFTGKLLGSIASRAGRMATGAGIELGTELIQERHNQIAEENVREGRDPWEGYSDKILDPKATKETLIQIGPVALMGAAAHITSKSDKQIAAERVADLLAKNSLADVLGSGGVAQWMAQMRLRDGDNVVKQAVAALYLGGHIDEKQADLMAALDQDGRLAHDEAVESMLTKGQAPAYVALRAQGLAMERHAAGLPEGPAKEAATERAKNMALQAKNIILGAPADYVQVRLPGGMSMVMDVQAATRMLTPEKAAEFALNGVLNNGVSVSGFGKGTGVVAAFQKMVDAAHKKMADDLAQAKEAKEQERADAAAKAEYQASGERMIGEYAEDMPAYVDAVLDEAYETDKKPTTSAKERLRLAEAAVKYLEERHRELTAKYKGQPNSVKTLKNIKGDLDRVRALRRSLYQQVNQKPKGSLRQDMAAAAASAVVPVSETNETGGTKSEGTNGGAVTLSPPGTANMVAALSPEDDALLEDDENDTGSPSTNEPTTPPPAVQGIQGEDQGGAPAAPTDTGAAGGVPVEEPEEGGSPDDNIGLDVDELNNWTPDDDTYAQRPYRETPKTPIGKDVDTVMVDGVERPARNSNGQHIHPTIEGVRNFWRWFGDSMVVDEQGRPLVVYHGTRANIEQFSNEKLGTNTAASTASLGHFFSNMPFVSERFAGYSEMGGSIMPMYVRITKAALDLESDLARKTTSDGFKYGPVTRTIYGLPIVNKDAYDKLHENLRSLGFSKRADDHKTYSHFGDISMSLGYDGIVLRNTKMDGGGDLNNHYIVFSPTGAKSATGNNGYWSDESESIVEQKPHDGQKKQEYTGKPRIDRIIKALAGLAPNLTITIAKTQEEYAALVKGLDKKVASGWGVFYRDANGRPRIVVNSSAPNVANTLFHEASHPIIAALAHSRPDLFQKFYNEAIKADGGKYERYGNLYKDKSTQVQQEEAIVQYVADILSAIANKKIPVSTRKDSLYQQVKAFIQDILAALGWDTRNIDLSKPDNVREMAGQIAKALEKGIKITGLTPSANSKGEAYLKADADRLVNGWYSRLRDAVNSKGRTQPASEWKNWIAARAKEGAFSLEEAKWTGLSDWLDSKGKEKVTPEEVREFLNENRVRVEVKELSDATAKETLSPDVVIEEDEDGSWMLYSDTGTEGPFNSEEEARAFGIQYGYTEADSSRSDDSPITRHSKWQLPGGSNYREIAITIPGPEKYRVPAEHSMGEKADVNRVLHMRFNDRTGPNGEKVLFIEELQSDWGQQGKKKGFKQKRQDGTEGWTASFEENKFAPGGGWWTVKLPNGDYGNSIGANQASSAEEAIRIIHEKMLDRPGWETNANDQKTSPAPFVTSTEGWVELGLKQAIRMAVEGGYDRIAWTTGEQQNERYDLSKKVSTVNYAKRGDGKYEVVVMGLDGNQVYNSTLAENELEDVVGKEVAEKIVEGNGSKTSGGFTELSGDGLKVGGSGMRGFYDKILPNMAGKVGRKLGGDGKVGSVTLGTPEDAATEVGTQQGIAITPAMRQQVGGGVPMMQLSGTKGTGPDPAKVSAFAAVLNAQGLTPQQARAHMEARGYKPRTIEAVLEAMTGAPQGSLFNQTTGSGGTGGSAGTGSGGPGSGHVPPTPPPSPPGAPGTPGGRPIMTPDEVQAIMDKQRADAKGRQRSFPRRAWEWWVKNFEHRRGVADRLLKENSLDPAGAARAIMLKNLAAGASAKAKRDFRTYHDAVHKGLSAEEKAVLDDIIQYRRTVSVDARRDAQMRERVKHPGGMNGEDAQRKLDDMRHRTPALFNKLNARADSYFKAMDDLLRQTYDAGLITEEVYQDLKDDEYSPRKFAHHLLDAETRMSVGGMDITGNGIKSLTTGSEESLFNNSEWLLAAHTASVHKRIYNNEANAALHKHIATLGTDRDNPGVGYVLEEGETPKPGYMRVGSFVDGKEQAVALMNEIAVPWTADNPVLRHDAANALRIVSGGAFKRLAVTGINPAFALSNLPRDIAHVLVLTDTYSNALPIGLAQLTADIKKVSADVWQRKGRYTEYINEGGGMDFLTYQGKPLTGGDVSLEQSIGDRVMHVAGYLNETSELLVRIAIREREITKRTAAFAKAHGRAPSKEELADIKREATAKAREQMDFGQGGQTAKFIDNLIPYFNATLQGTRVMVRTARTDPKRFAAKLAQLGAFSVALVLYNMRFDEWDEVPDHEKENNFIIFLPFTRTDENGHVRRMYLKIPKSQDQRAFAGAFEGMAEFAKTGKFPTKRSTHAFYEALPIKPTTPLDIPLVDAMNTYLSNYDRFHDTEVSRGYKKVEPWKEYTPGRTEQFYRDIGMLTSRIDEDGDRVDGASPERLKAAVGKLTGLSKGNLFHEMFQKNYDVVGAALGREGAVEFDKTAREHIEEMTVPFTRRITGWSDPQKTRESTLERFSRKEATRRAMMNDQVKEGIARYRKAKTEAERIQAHEAMQKIMGAMPKEDQKRAFERYKTGIKQTGVDYALIDILHEPVVAVRVRALMDHIEGMTDREKDKVEADGYRIGLFTKSFVAEYERLMAEKARQHKGVE